MPLVTVCDRYAKAYPGSEPGPASVLDLDVALRTEYPYDAHVTQYASSVPHRLSSDAVGHAPITIGCILFDVDGPEHTCPDEWWALEKKKIVDLREIMPGIVAYRTRGGYRIVGTICPVEVNTQKDADDWTWFYKTNVRWLHRALGVAADMRCADWQHLFRLPYVRRGLSHERLEVLW